jgi:hypothetical protein
MSTYISGILEYDFYTLEIIFIALKPILMKLLIIEIVFFKTFDIIIRKISVTVRIFQCFYFLFRNYY